MTKTRDTRSRSQLLIGAYTECLVGVFALRLPGVAEIVRRDAPEMTVKTSYPGEDLNLHAANIVAACSKSGPEIHAAVEQVTCIFVAAMWDTLFSHTNYEAINTKPEVQFMRHLRHACAHNGRWNFTELKHPAVWRDKELKLEHSGTRAFGGLLNHGDPMLLFQDIDHAYF